MVMELSKAQQKLLEISADNADDIEADVEEMAEKSSRIINDVMTNPAMQDREIFAALGVPLGTTVQGLSAVPVLERGKEWNDAFAGLVAAARLIAWIDTQGIDTLKLAEKHNAKIGKQLKKLSTAEKKQAGKSGVRKDGRQAAKERRNGRRNKV